MLVVVAVRIRFLDLPLERDEGEYAYGAQLLLRGGLPFRDLYTLKLPGAHAAYVPSVLLFGETKVAVRLGLLAVNLGTAALLYLLARRLAGATAGMGAAALYLVAAASLSLLGLFAHATQFLVLPMVAGVLALQVAPTRASPGRWLVLSGFLLGLAVLVKQHAVVFVLFGAGIAYLHRRRARDVAMVLAGSVVPALVLAAVLTAAGSFDAFWLWCFRYAPQYVSLMPIDRGLMIAGLRALDIGASLPGIVALAAWGLWAWRRSPQRGFLLGWLLTSAASVCPGLYFREHYFVPLVPAVAVLAGIGARDLARRGGLWTGVAALLVVGSALFPLWRDRVFLLERDDRIAMRRLYGPQPFAEAVEVARFLHARARPGDKLGILGSEPQILFLSGIPSATGYMYTYPMMEPHSLAVWMQEDLMRRLEAAPPRWIVLVSARSSWWEPYGDVPKPILPWMDRFLPQHYDVVGVADIVSPYRTVYLWDDAARKYEGKSRSQLWVYRRKSP